MDKTWTREQIIELIDKRDDAVIRGMIRIYELQTEDEQNVEDTMYQNGVGFNGADANIMSSFVTFYKKFGYLSPKQMVIARKKMRKYSRQLVRIANGEILTAEVVDYRR